MKTILRPPTFEIRNNRICVRYNVKQGTWGLSSADGNIRLAESAVTVNFPERQVHSSNACKREAKQQAGRDRLGNYTRLRRPPA